MVQYRLDLRGHLAYRPDLDPDHYWKLETVTYLKDTSLDHEFQRLKLYRNAHLSKQRKVCLCARAQQGYLSYDIYGLAELKDFARRRKIPLPHGRLTAALLVRQLERADKNTKFPRFSELPPELRQAVSEQYFASLAKERMKLVFKQPPVTMASRLLRTEALPLFYRMITFELEVRKCRSFPKDYYRVHKRPNWILDRGSGDLVDSISDENSRLIRRLAITLQPVTSRQHVRLMLEFEDEGGVTLEKFEFDWLRGGSVVKRLVKESEAIVKDVVEREEVHKLKKADVERLQDAVDRVLNDWEP